MENIYHLYVYSECSFYFMIFCVGMKLYIIDHVRFKSSGKLINEVGEHMNFMWNRVYIRCKFEIIL